nr:PQQ-dependent catabolism-associated CXXCW motif protein [Aurantimonas sp. CSK15Z-1]
MGAAPNGEPRSVQPRFADASEAGANGPTPPEPQGYRMGEYRAPTPATLEGAEVIDVTEAERLWRDKGAAFVDVLPRAPRPKDLPAGTVWRPKPRDDIPGSLWLVDTGYGALPPAMEAYFEAGLEEATGGDRSRPVVLYCQRDCWMSWNAGKRAVALGYTGIRWFPGGTDAWGEAGLPLERAEPQNRPDE